MNLKKRAQMLLLLTALTLTLSAQTSGENRKSLDNDLGLDLTRTYSGTEVQAIIDIILEEADKSIDEAYKEGYKQATIELQPEIDYWKKMYDIRKSNTFNDNLKFTLIGFSSGIVIGTYTGLNIGLKISF